jgi:hypothetical protein
MEIKPAGIDRVAQFRVAVNTRVPGVTNGRLVFPNWTGLKLWPSAKLLLRLFRQFFLCRLI